MAYDTSWWDLVSPPIRNYPLNPQLGRVTAYLVNGLNEKVKEETKLTLKPCEEVLDEQTI